MNDTKNLNSNYTPQLFTRNTSKINDTKKLTKFNFMRKIPLQINRHKKKSRFENSPSIL